jgi:hypothetical protein
MTWRAMCTSTRPDPLPLERGQAGAPQLVTQVVHVVVVEGFGVGVRMPSREGFRVGVRVPSRVTHARARARAARARPITRGRDRGPREVLAQLIYLLARRRLAAGSLISE